MRAATGAGRRESFDTLGWARVRTNHHWLSDGVLGAAIGITAGLAVTKDRPTHWTIVPAKTKGGAALFFIRR